ncbi:nucleotide-diphospho-sugar transferase [Helicostylum pulchrum]|nr:nucleotide-diphospho-sugar transferase [Helicostylum pulchrum]
MVYLHDNPFNVEPASSNNSKSSYKRRRLYKIITRVLLISALSISCYFFGRNVQWQSLSESYSFDPRDADFIRYFCSQPSIVASDSMYDIPDQPEQPNELLEHVRAGYFTEEIVADTYIPKETWKDLPVKGAYYMVVRNEDLYAARSVIKSMRDHMANGTRYPWIFLNNQHFTKDFKTYVSKVIDGPVFFGKIDLRVWEYPYWIDIPLAEYKMLEQETNGVHKGSSLSYHQLLRYHTGFFFHHALFKDVEYTWRVEAGADYSCKMNQDLFLQMKNEKKKLGFVITMRESAASIPTLWTRVNEFMEYYPEHVLPEDSTIYPWIYDADEDDYNLCHFWSNFQLADLSFFRSPAYQKFFEYLDKTGNFFYERWGDAPVQTIAAALFLKKEEIKFFNEIGYTHSIATHCPYNEALLRQCSCDVTVNYGKLFITLYVV